MRVSHQDVEAGGFEQCDLVGDGERGEARKLLSELHRFDDALGGELAEFIPQIHVQRDTSLRTVTLYTHTHTAQHNDVGKPEVTALYLTVTTE